jgi:hypothetical protein
MVTRRKLRSVLSDRPDPCRAADDRRHPSGPPETDMLMIQTARTTGPASKRRPVTGPILPRPQGSFRPPGRSAAPAEPRPQAARGAGPQRRGRPFRDAEACITWMVQALVAEAEGAPRRAGSSICAPAEVVKCLDTLYRRRRIDLHHVRILRLWGHRGRAPDAANPMEKADWRTWREALDRLDWPLRSLGIIS